jgi:hypothetical protein
LATAPTPVTFAQPTPEALAISGVLRRQIRFFHWELEFPDVFTADRAGFDALLGNPPWEIQKPNSKEWFSNVDPLYRTYGKTEAVAKQTDFFTADRAVEDAWLSYVARLKALSNFTKFAAFAFGDPSAHQNDAFHFTIVSRRAAENDALHARWRPKRARLTGFADPAHSFRHQGSADINTYKLFAEQSLALMRSGGRFGFILPSGIYSDKGSATLRGVLLDQSSWEWCFGFENREGIFDIHRSFKFAAIIVSKDNKTVAVRTAFMRRHVEDWAQAESMALDYPRALVDKLSPFSKALVEIRDPRDVTLLDRMYSRAVLLGDQSPRGWGLRYSTEFHMTNDAKLFPPLPKWEALGYRPDEYGHWLKGPWQPVSKFRVPGSELEKWLCSPHVRASSVPLRPRVILSRNGTEAIRVEDISDVAVPLYEGRMIGQFDFSQKGWVSGKGRTAEWRDIPWEEKRIEPQFLMGLRTFFDERLESHLNAIAEAQDDEAAERERRRLSDVNEFMEWWARFEPKTCFMDVSSATNQRGMISSALRDFPAGNKTPVLWTQRGTELAVALDSFCYDYALRQRLGGLTLNYFIIEETPLPLKGAEVAAFAELGRRLMFTSPLFSQFWKKFCTPRTAVWQSLWALTEHERLRLRCITDALSAQSLALDMKDLAWILRDTDRPIAEMRDRLLTGKLDPKGFWRVDKEREPELRHPVLAQVALADLQAQGLDAFLEGPKGDGWQLPATLRLADYGLGRDGRACEPQPVASRFGPRFLPWQLEKDPATSWVECDAHATLLDQLWRHSRTMSDATRGEVSDGTTDAIELRETPAKYSTPSKQSELGLI